MRAPKLAWDELLRYLAESSDRGLERSQLNGMDGVAGIRRELRNVLELIDRWVEREAEARLADCICEFRKRGYVLKSDLAEYLVKAVKDVSAGKSFLTPKVSEIVLKGFVQTGKQAEQTERSQGQLTPREMEILRLLAGGKVNKEIAALLGITVRTVETHRAKIMLKLGLHSLAELIHYALRHGIVSAGV